MAGIALSVTGAVSLRLAEGERSGHLSPGFRVAGCVQPAAQTAKCFFQRAIGHVVDLNGRRCRARGGPGDGAGRHGQVLNHSQAFDHALSACGVDAGDDGGRKMLQFHRHRP